MTGAPLRIRALQAVMLRLTVDPAWGARVYAGAADARVISTSHGPYTLSAEDLALLRAVDPRAWTTDAYRRARLVQALVEEYALTTAMVGIPSVDAFFGSEAFGTVLGHRGSMAESFGTWLVERMSGAARQVVALELAVVRARRPHRPPGVGYVTRCGVEGLVVSEGTLAAWQEGLRTLGASPLESVAQGMRWSPPALGKGEEALLIERKDGGGLGVHGVRRSTAGLLIHCRTPCSRADIVLQAKRLRIPKKQVGKILRSLVDKELLTLRPG